MAFTVLLWAGALQTKTNMEYNLKFGLWQTVVLVHDPDRVKRMVVQAKVSGVGVMYSLAVGDKESWHYEAEVEQAGEVERSVGFKMVTP